VNQEVYYEDGKVHVSWPIMRRVAKHSGLRSKKGRHIKKRFKLWLHEAIRLELI
jgi:hypothetical protein